MTRDGKRQTQHFVPALYHSLQALLDVAHVGFSLAETEEKKRRHKKRIVSVKIRLLKFGGCGQDAFNLPRANLFIHYFPALVSLSFAKSFGLFAPLHQRVVEEGLEHT